MRSLLLAGIAFALAYTQSPVGFSNQNQYLLHGFAQSGYGQLDGDWLTNTRDPTPLFSGWIALTRSAIPAIPIYASYGAILILYVVSLASLIGKTVGLPATWPGRWLIFSLLLLSHAAVWRWLSVLATGVDYPWYFQCGVAGQYILGAGFQPSVFGVLLVASLAAFANERPILAAACAVGACAVHFTYLVPASLMGLGYLASTKIRLGWKPTLRLALAFSIGLAPVAVYNAVQFLPADATTFAEAQRLLVEVRIPHHAVVQKWLDPIAGIQITWVGLSIWFVRRSPLAAALLVALAFAAILTAVAALANIHLLALLFPWRVSAVLVPVATAIIAGKLALALERQSKRATVPFAGLVIVASVAFAIVQLLHPVGYNMNDTSERGLLEFVGRNSKRGDVYLIPTRIPNLAGGRRGNISTTFTPPPRPASGNLIAVDLQRFRLATGAPIFIDFKSIPYADVELIEWHRRVGLTMRWYREANWGRILEELRREGITHVVVGSDSPIVDPHYSIQFEDTSFRVYRLQFDSHPR